MQIGQTVNVIFGGQVIGTGIVLDMNRQIERPDGSYPVELLLEHGMEKVVSSSMCEPICERCGMIIDEDLGVCDSPFCIN